MNRIDVTAEHLDADAVPRKCAADVPRQFRIQITSLQIQAGDGFVQS